MSEVPGVFKVDDKENNLGHAKYILGCLFNNPNTTFTNKTLASYLEKQGIKVHRTLVNKYTSLITEIPEFSSLIFRKRVMTLGHPLHFRYIRSKITNEDFVNLCTLLQAEYKKKESEAREQLKKKKSVHTFGEGKQKTSSICDSVVPTTLPAPTVPDKTVHVGKQFKTLVTSFMETFNVQEVSIVKKGEHFNVSVLI